MPTFLRQLATQILDPTFHTIDDAEASLLLDLAVADAGERFKPSSLSVARIVRFKQEMHTIDRVIHEFPQEGRSADLHDMERFLRVWYAYESRKGLTNLDRGDVALQVCDAIARAQTTSALEDIIATPTLVFMTHGLAHVDRTIMHLLARHGAQIGIQFAPHRLDSSRSLSDGMWLVGHGWYDVTISDARRLFASIHGAWPTQREEVRRALAFLKSAVERGEDPAGVALIVPGNGSYDDIVGDVAASAAIPITLEPVQLLSTTPSAAALFSACQVVLNDWEPEDVSRLASSPAVDLGKPLTSVLEAAVQFRIVGGDGPSGWLRRLAESRNALADVLINEDDRDVRRSLMLADEGRRACEVLRDALAGHRSRMTILEFVGWLEGSVSRAMHIDMSEALHATFEMYADIDRRHSLGTLSLRDHVKHWWGIVCRQHGDANGLAGGLCVLRPNEVRGQQFSHIVAIGFVNGILPSRNGDPIEESVMSGLREAVDLEALSDIIHAVADGGTLMVTRPHVIDGDPTVSSPFIDMVGGLASSTEVIEDRGDVLLLTLADVQAFVDGRSIHTEERQQGLKRAALTDEESQAVLERSASTLSPSRVDLMISCPYRFFGERLLGLHEAVELDEVLSPLERGSLMHRVAHAWFSSFREETEPSLNTPGDVERSLIDITTYPTEELMVRLVDVFEVERSKVPKGYLYDEVERRMYLDSGSRPGLLRRWLEAELADQKKHPFRPLLFELDIEMKVPITEGRHEQVKLRIDRVDAFVDDAGIHVSVVDYKTTTFPAASSIRQGRSTQMPFYLASIREWFQVRGLVVSVESANYHTFGKNVHDADHPSVKGSIAGNELERIMAVIEPHIDQLRAIEHGVSPQKGACAVCHLHELCRVDQWGRFS